MTGRRFTKPLVIAGLVVLIGGGAAAGFLLSAGESTGGADRAGSTSAWIEGDAPREPIRIACCSEAELGADAEQGRTANVYLAGKAAPMRQITLKGQCRDGGCEGFAVADRRGWWEAEVPISVPDGAKAMRVSAAYSWGGSRQTIATRRIRFVEPRVEPAVDNQPAQPPGGVFVPGSVTTDWSGSGSVLVVGDSLEVLTSPHLRKYLNGVDVTVNAVGGYSSIQILSLFRQSFRPDHRVVVFDAGTNDNPSYPQILEEQLATATRLAPGRCFVVPTIHGLTVNGVDSSGKNAVVRQFAATYPIVETPDWESLAKSRRDLMQPDDLHPNVEGADARAQLIASAVRRCLSRVSAR